MNLEHRRAQEISSLAALYLRQSRLTEARSLFAEAAALEKLAFAKVPLDKPRSRGILAVSLAALLFKAGSFEEAESQVRSLLADPHIAVPARRQLTDLLTVIHQEPQPRSRGHVQS